jgi:hypothetical protein
MASIASQKPLVFVTSLDGHQNMRYSWQYFLQKPSQRYASETTVNLRNSTRTSVGDTADSYQPAVVCVDDRHIDRDGVDGRDGFMRATLSQPRITQKPGSQ